MSTEMQQAAPGHWRELSIGFDQAAAKLPEALKQEGFGVITEIDLQQTFKAKLGVDFTRYRIFGACNPSFALELLQGNERMGVFLPCNVVLYEKEDGRAAVGAVDPLQTLGAFAVGSEIAELAREVATRLERVLNDLDR